MQDKDLDIIYYLANAIVSDPSIGQDAAYLQSIPRELDMPSKEAGKFRRLFEELVRVSGSIEKYSAKALSHELGSSRIQYAKELGSAIEWADRNRRMMQTGNKSRQSVNAEASEYSEDSALDAFLG